MSYALATITNPSAALTDFSLIVDLSRMPADWWTAVDTTDGTRGRVYKGDGVTQLAADWIDFDNVADTGLLRVKWTGTLATTGTQQLWIEPPVTGNATVAANATYGSDNAYDANWEGYWPLEEDPSGTAPQMIDRTSNDRNGTSVGSMTSADLVAAKVGNGLDFDGTDDSVSLSTGDIGSVTEYHVSAWVNASSIASADGVVFNRSNLVGLVLSSASGNPLTYMWDGTSDEWSAATGLTIPTDDSYVFVSVTIDSDKAVVRRGASGSLSSWTNTKTHASKTINGLTHIAEDTTSSRHIGAIIDDVQIHSTERSADWISSEYDQTSDQATFYGTWTWEADTGDALTADNLTTGAPTLGAPTIEQEHALTAQALTTGAVTLDEATLAQTHSLTADALTTGSPTLGEPTVAEAHVLTADGVTTGAPTLDESTIAQTHALTADALAIGTPTLGTPVLADIGDEVDNLEADALTTGAVVLGQSTVAQLHILTADGMLTGAVSLGQPTLHDQALVEPRRRIYRRTA